MTRIIIIDDDQYVLSVAESLLNDLGEVITSPTVNIANALPTANLVIMDWHIGKCAERERLLQSCALLEIPVVIWTGDLLLDSRVSPFPTEIVYKPDSPRAAAEHILNKVSKTH
jgi:CheY-like chemotaxis protein